MAELWRTGRSVGRTLYVDNELIGMVDSPELAQQIVTAVNATAHLWAPDEADLRIEQIPTPGQLGHQGDRGVRITHLPTGLAVERLHTRSYLDNRAAALRELRARLVESLGQPEAHRG